MYPLFLKPALKDFIWGGDRILQEYGYSTDLPKVAEAWVLSSHPQGAAAVINGPLAGRTLPQALGVFGQTALGNRGAAFENFPLLIKFIDAQDKLSVQVHPDDEYSLRVEGEYGKTEMWYVLDCEPEAMLLYGVSRSLTKEEFRQHITNNTLEEVCNYVPVKKGDVFFIPAGTLHAIGGGILLAEVQQNSAITYRVSDYGRLDADGRPRPLHIDKALDVTTLEPTPLCTDGIERIKDENGTITLLSKCAYFTVEAWQVSGARPVGAVDTFQSLLCLDGKGSFVVDGATYDVKKGDSLFLPAGIIGTMTGELDVLCSYV